MNNISKNFIIIFHEKEGTSPIVRLLNNFDNVSIIHQIENSGWEPFDKHNAGEILLKDFLHCVQLIAKRKEGSFEKINSIYTKTSTKPLEKFQLTNIIGYKMRLRPKKLSYLFERFSKYYIVKKILDKTTRRQFIRTLKKNNITVFIAVRENHFLKAVSKYHGDGTGKRGHLQFMVASGNLKKEDIPKIKIDPNEFNKFIQECKLEFKQKKDLFTELQNNGVRVFPMIYEEFLKNKYIFFRRFFQNLNFTITDHEIADAIEKGSFFRKVHSGDLNSFILNAEEIETTFGKEYENWVLN